MTLFEFLSDMSKERFPFHMQYIEWSGHTEVHIDAFYERWVITFGEDGFVGSQRYQEAEWSDLRDSVLVLFDRPCKAWLKAAADLGLRFISPYRLTGPGGEDHIVTGLLPDFGHGKGSLILSRKDPPEAHQAANPKEYLLSGLNPYYYDRYDRDQFIETLVDWGWCGKGEPPLWFEEKA